MTRRNGAGGWLGLALAVVLAAAVGPLGGGAAAAELTDYQVETFAPKCGAAASGNMDRLERVYFVCRPADPDQPQNPRQIVRVDANGTSATIFTADFDMSDVAPSPTGAFLYVAQRRAFSTEACQQCVERLIRRVDRGQDNVYRLNAGWRAGFNGGSVEGMFLDTDDAGNLYVAYGRSTFNSYNKAVKIASADGELIPSGTAATTSFDLGEVDPQGRAKEHDLSGIAVNDAGTQVFVVARYVNCLDTEKPACAAVADAYVRKFTLAGGQYQPGPRWPEAGTRVGCEEGQLASPYDAGVDGAGNVFVTNTSCGRIEQLSAGLAPQGWKCVKLADTPCWNDDGSPVVGAMPADSVNRPHGLAVGADDAVFVPQTNKVMRKATSPTALTVTGVRPKIGSAGTAVTITGTGFGTAAGATTVKFGPLAPVAAECASTTQCTVAAPTPTASTTTVQVSVTVGGRTSAANGAASEFHYRPVLNSIDPRTTAAGSPGFSLTLTGANFGGTAKAVWNGTDLPAPTSRSATQLVVPVPAGFVATAGTYPVTVRNGSGAKSNPRNFIVAGDTVTLTAPTANSIVGAGTRLAARVTGRVPS